MPNALAIEEKPKAKAKTSGNNRGELCRIEIEVADNGFEVECFYESKKKHKGNMPMGYPPESEKKVFESGAAMIEFLEDMIDAED